MDIITACLKYQKCCDKVNAIHAGAYDFSPIYKKYIPPQEEVDRIADNITKALTAALMGGLKHE